MAARSVTVTFTNNCDLALIRNNGNLSHGEWDTEPPLRIEAGTTVTWESESDGVATGTEGEVYYDIETFAGQTGGQVHVHWDDPFIGSNSYDESCPDGYQIGRSGGSGNDADVTWVFDNASSTGDGIPDDWKRNGATIDPGDGSGPQFVDLPSMGADVNKPDIFIQLDWMADATHSHAPSPAAIKTVVDAFASCPYISRNGSIGINLHVDAGPNSIMNFATNQTWGPLSRAKQVTEVTNFGTATLNSNGTLNAYNWTAFDAVKNAAGGFTSTGRTPIFHYCISAHQIATVNNSGVARAIPGSDFIVSLGGFPQPVSDQTMSGTIMHELGHNLGLQHGGGDGTNNKPNYVSVMNYLWQTVGLTRNGTGNIVDYSNAAFALLNEANLDESTGCGPAATNVAIAHWVPASGGNPAAFVQVADGSGPVDWNGDGDTTDKNLSFDINNDSSTATLSGFNDWANLRLKGGAIGAGGQYQPPAQSSIVEVRPEDLQRVMPADTTPPVTTASVWPAPNASGWNRTDVQVTLSATDDISGVARTVYDLDSTGESTATAPIPIGAEAVHGLDYHSVDRSQNVEASKQLAVRIDKTAPEVLISYDPETDEIVVTGRDSLSGVNPGPVPAVFSAPTQWTPFGSDVAERRVYRIVDHADNETYLELKVRCSPRKWELSILRIGYDDAHGEQPNDRSARGYANSGPPAARR